MKKDICKTQSVNNYFENKSETGCNITTFKQLFLTIITLILVVFCCLPILVSCERNEVEIDKEPSVSTHSDRCGVYPKYGAGTRSGENGFWESWRTITLSRGQKVNTPWNPSSVTSTVPHDILTDVMYDDGWDLIFYMLNDLNGKDFRGNSPYLIFHNRYTGILKGFCYLSPGSFHPNNYGVWQISTDNPTSLFAFQNNPITKISDKQANDYYVSNITSNASHGFSIGWNCFQIELAYDPSQCGWLTISTLASNNVTLSLSGNLKADTKGLMTASQGNDNYGKGVAKIAGDEAGNWINTKINDKTILGIPASIVSEGVKSIVSWGAGSIIGAITGLFKNDNTVKSIQLTTNGTCDINGSATFQSTTGISPLKISIEPTDVGYLGVWGLKEEPTLLFSPYAAIKSSQEYTNGYTREYNVSIVNSGAKASLIVNPELYKHVNKINVKTDYYQSDNYTRRNVWGSTGVLGRDPINSNKIYDNLYKPNLFMIADVAFKGDENQYLYVDQYEPPMEIFIPNVPNGPEGAVSNFRYDSKFLASVGVELALQNASVAYSLHRCVPKIDWNFSEYDNGLYWYFYPCEPVIQLQSNNRNMQQSVIKADSHVKSIIK